MKTIGYRSYCDTLEDMVKPGRAAVLVIDQQNDFCHPDGYYARDLKLDISMLEEITHPINRLTAAARKRAIPVVFTQNHIKQGFVSDAPVWLATHVAAGLKSLDQDRFFTMEGTWGAEIYDRVQVEPDDIIVPKLRSTAFHNTPLEALLRARGIETVIIAGQVAEGCVDNTIRGARDRDFYTVLVADGIGSTSEERQAGVLRTWKGRIPVPTTDELLAIWGGEL
jgi:ureidoacrylate peracid hydrolase